MDVRSTDRIAIDPRVMAGQPVIKGTRITVALILRELGRGATPAEIVDSYPHLNVKDVYAAANYAADVLSDEPLLALE
jgi:uncharacterized protein (DUF433 family)